MNTMQSEQHSIMGSHSQTAQRVSPHSHTNTSRGRGHVEHTLRTAAKLDTRPSKSKGHSRQLAQLFTLYSEAMDRLHLSALSKSLDALLQVKNRPRINKIVSLGLGSFGPSKDQHRRIKQLVIFVFIASTLSSERQITLHAQDPSFTKTDEGFLQSLGIRILKTSSPSELGDAARMIDAETLIYSPFLTINAYRQLFAPVSAGSQLRKSAPMLIGDDFNALRLKWEKYTIEYKDVDELIKAMKRGNYQRRVIEGQGFWDETDNTFPMALYRIQKPAIEMGVASGGGRIRGKL